MCFRLRGQVDDHSKEDQENRVRVALERLRKHHAVWGSLLGPENVRGIPALARSGSNALNVYKIYTIMETIYL